MELILAYSPGACSLVPMIALEEIGAAYEKRLVRFLKGEHKSPDYLQINPAGKVPTLIVDDVPLTQNVAILTWLARTFPQAGLLPLSGVALNDCKILSRLIWCSSDLHQLVTRIRLPNFSCDLPDSAERVREMAAIAMAAQLTPIEVELNRQPWLLGENWSLLDAYIFWIWFRITGAGFPVDRFPNLVGHHARMAKRPAVQRAIEIEARAMQQLKDEGVAPVFPAVAPIILPSA